MVSSSEADGGSKQVGNGNSDKSSEPSPLRKMIPSIFKALIAKFIDQWPCKTHYKEGGKVSCSKGCKPSKRHHCIICPCLTRLKKRPSLNTVSNKGANKDKADSNSNVAPIGAFGLSCELSHQQGQIYQ